MRRSRTVGGSDGQGLTQSVATQRKSLVGILLLMSLIPMVFLIISGIAMAFYPLRDQRMVQIESDLQQRKTDTSAEASD